MSEPSLYKPAASLTTSAPVNVNTVSDSEGAATTLPPDQSSVEVTLKRVLAGLVVLAGAGAAILPPHTIGYQVCVAILGLSGLGITSRGVQPKQ
jgi:energy-converting hydrogenase Eha subunit H